jgi:drug/metabolite transporter (DMT)-like permease
MPWVLFALLSVVCSATYSLISKKLLNNEDDHDPIAYVSSLFLVVGIISFTVYLITGAKSEDMLGFTNSKAVMILIANLLLYTVAPSMYWRALKYLPASEVTIFYDLTTVYIFIFGISLGTELFSITRLLGGLLIVGAAIAVGIATQRKSKIKMNIHFNF